MSKKIKSVGKIKGFTMQFMPFAEIKDLDSTGRIKKILDIVLKNEIILLQGKLRAEEETRLIGDTMAMISYINGFKGIELAVIESDEDDMFSKFKRSVASFIAGGDLSSLTIIGPATVVKEIKKNPKKIELLLNGIGK